MAIPLFDLSGRVAVVSGAARGMGRASALALAQFGADLVLADLDRDGAEETAAQIRALGRRAVPLVCNVGDPAQIDALFERLDREFGRIDFLANIAGEGRRVDPLEARREDLEFSLDHLVLGRFYACQQAGRRMIAAGRGSILNIVSIGGLTALGRGHLPYAIAMGAVAQMTRELSTEWASRGVRVNAVVCAQIENPDLRARIADDPNLRDAYLRGIPTGRLGRPEEIQGLAVFLASDASSFVTGALIPLDGGNLAKNAGGSHPGMPQATRE